MHIRGGEGRGGVWLPVVDQQIELTANRETITSTGQVCWLPPSSRRKGGRSRGRWVWLWYQELSRTITTNLVDSSSNKSIADFATCVVTKYRREVTFGKRHAMLGDCSWD